MKASEREAGIIMIKILVDSSSDYSLEEVREKNITLIPISITIGDQIYTDGINLDRNQFYEILETTGAFPKTSQPSPQAFLEAFQDAKKQGDELICILLSSALSGTFQSACLAKSIVDYDKIYLIDSLCATYNIKILADYACRLCGEGIPAPAIAEKIETLKTKVKVTAALDTLEYLKRGGRISKTAAAIGNIANIKPVITVNEEGGISIVGKCVGRNKAIHAVINHLKSETLNPDFPVYAIYSYGTTNCEKLEDKLKADGYMIDKRLQIGPTIGTHVGPEAFGIIYVLL